jgi:hypothetical protein
MSCILPLAYNHAFNPKRVLGGMVSKRQTQNSHVTLRVDRDGFVELCYVSQQLGERYLDYSLLLGGTGSVLGCYQNLRKLAGSPSMPCEVDAEVITMSNICPSFGPSMNSLHGEPLEFRTHFSSITVADHADFDDYLNAMAGDLANAGGLSASQLPRYRLVFGMSNQQ